jgi:hypothetical protein
MPNHNPNTEGLTQSKWIHKPVKVYRLPEAIADDVLTYARKLDKGERGTDIELDTAIELLNQSLTLPANKGGAIKRKIREALELLAER